MNINEIIKLDKQNCLNTYGDRTPVNFENGFGLELYDNKGNTYFDFLSGISVNSIGHSHPKLIEAIKSQSEKFIHCSNLYYIESQAKLAEKLNQIGCFDKVFFCNSGAEANEAAIKISRIYFSKIGKPEKNEIISLKNSFHGRTLIATTATGQDKFHKHIKPLPQGFFYVNANDIEDLKSTISDSTCAIILEAIQGEGGINLIDPDYMKSVKELCDKYGILLIFDEIQTGIGKTGKMFAYEHFGIQPDIVTLAKGLGGGFPIGAMCIKEQFAKVIQPGDHGSTFGGNPLACTAALTVLETIESENLVDNCNQMGQYFVEKLNELRKKTNVIKDIRGKGLLIGIELVCEKAVEVKNKCFENKYLIGSIGNNILRLSPPLIIKENAIDKMVETLDKILKEYS